MELVPVEPEEWVEVPEFVNNIEDEAFKGLAIKMNTIWKHLTRRIIKSKEEIESKSSLIYLENPFVVPGGR